MLVYEVQIQIHQEIRPEYEIWLEEHIRQILALPYFAGAHWFELVSQISDRPTFIVQYRTDSQEKLDRYLTQAAPSLRAEAEHRFAGRFQANRRVLKLKNDFRDE